MIVAVAGGGARRVALSGLNLFANTFSTNRSYAKQSERESGDHRNHPSKER